MGDVVQSCSKLLIPKKDHGEIRVWCDGCYDMVHFGHANSLRQAKEFGAKLFVGVHSDAEICHHKGPPVFTEQERYDMVRAIKWVDFVVEKAPYVTTLETLDMYDCNFCAHGDDITTTADGVDTYQEVKDAGRYVEYKRTQGVSTTDLVDRMLFATRDHFRCGDNTSVTETENTKEFTPENARGDVDINVKSPWTGKNSFLPTTGKLRKFSEGVVEPKEGDKIVYVAGAFDVLHPGHLHFLEQARKLGDFLIVGLHTDSTVNMYKGSNFPIMNLQERVLSLLACKYVSDVVMGAPYVVTSELLEHFKVQVVAHGNTPVKDDPKTHLGPYDEPKKRGIFVEVNSKSSLTTEMVVQRIVANRKVYEERNAKKEEKENAILAALKEKDVNNNKEVEVES